MFPIVHRRTLSFLVNFFQVFPKKIIRKERLQFSCLDDVTPMPFWWRPCLFCRLLTCWCYQGGSPLLSSRVWTTRLYVCCHTSQIDSSIQKAWLKVCQRNKQEDHINLNASWNRLLLIYFVVYFLLFICSVVRLYPVMLTFCDVRMWLASAKSGANKMILILSSFFLALNPGCL